MIIFSFYFYKMLFSKLFHLNKAQRFGKLEENVNMNTQSMFFAESGHTEGHRLFASLCWTRLGTDCASMTGLSTERRSKQKG